MRDEKRAVESTLVVVGASNPTDPGTGTARTTPSIPYACVGKREKSPGQLRRPRNFRPAIVRRTCRDSRSPSPGNRHVRDQDSRRNHVGSSARTLARNAAGCANLPPARRRCGPRQAVLTAEAFRRPTGSFASPLPPPRGQRLAMTASLNRSVPGFALSSPCINANLREWACNQFLIVQCLTVPLGELDSIHAIRSCSDVPV